VFNQLEMLSGRGKKECAKEAQAAADEGTTPVIGSQKSPSRP
jgi:hypothetical protein